MRRIRRTGWAALAVVAACDGSRAGTPGGGAPEGLEGSWTVELRLEHPIQLRADPAAVEPVRGEVVLLRDAHASRGGVGAPGLPSYYGSHAVDVRPFGIALPRSGRVPTVSARPAGADSVVLVLEPDASGGGLTLSGRVEGDSAVGRWWWYGRGRHSWASGRFTLRRGTDCRGTMRT